MSRSEQFYKEENRIENGTDIAPDTQEYRPLSLLDLDDRFLRSRELAKEPKAQSSVDNSSPDKLRDALKGLLESPYEKERKDAERLQRLLNSPNESDRKFAERVLKSINDMEYRNALLNAWGKPDLKAGAGKVLDLLESRNKKERLEGSEFLGLLSHTNERERKTGETLLKLLGGNEKEQRTASTIINRLEGNERHKMLELIDSKENEAGTEKLLKYLEGTPEQRSAAKSLLHTLERDEETGGKLFKMLGDPKSEDRAFLILHRLDSPGQRKEMLRILEDPKSKDGAEELMRMLASKDVNDVKAVKEALGMLGADFNPDRLGGIPGAQAPFDRTDGEKILKLLGSKKEEDRDFATRLLKISDKEARKTLLDMSENPQQKEVAERLLKMLGDSKDSEIANKLLSAFRGPDAADQIEKMFAILDTPKFAQAAAQLRMMSAGDIAHLASLLPPEFAKRYTSGESGGERLLEMLNDPDKLGSALRILKARFGAEESSALYSLLSNPDTEKKGKAILELALRERPRDDNGIPIGPNPRNGVSNLLKMYQSAIDKDKEASTKEELAATDKEKEDARKEKETALKEKETVSKALDLLANPETKRAAESMIATTTQPEQVRRLVEALTNPRERRGAEQLLKMMESTGRDSRNALALVDMLNSPDEATRRGAEKMLTMLGDPAQERAAKTIIEVSRNSRSLEKLVALMGKEDGLTAGEKQALKQIGALSASSSQSDRKALENLMGLMTSDNPDLKKNGELLAGMLADSALKDKAHAVLSKLENPFHCSQLIDLLKNSGTEQGGKILMEMLASGKDADIKGVRSLLGLTTSERTREGLVGGESGGVGQKLFMELVGKLGNSETRELTKQVLSLSESTGSLLVLSEMMKDPAHRKDIDKLSQMAASKEGLAKVQTLLSQQLSPKEVHAVLELMLDDTKRKESQRLLDLFTSEDVQAQGAAFIVAQMLASEKQNEREAGQRLLEALGDPNKQKHLLKVLSVAFSPDQKSALGDVISKPENELALETLGELLNATDTDESLRNTEMVANLAAQLSNGNPEKRKEALRIVQMLADPKHRSAGLRLLEQLPPPTFKQYG